VRPVLRLFIISATTAALLAASASAAAPPADLVLGDAERRQASIPAAGAERPVHPIAGRVDYGSSDAGFGAARSGHVHSGQDVFAPAGTSLVAVEDGIVVEAGSDAGRGNYVALFDPERRRTYVYFHMLEPTPVRQGDRVAAGKRLGAVGCSGSCWGDHLHFEVRLGRGAYGEAIDPLPLLHRWRVVP
jgi:murein DD-endopeptidase MepM/ murein hydrolase activator NlpD